MKLSYSVCKGCIISIRLLVGRCKGVKWENYGEKDLTMEKYSSEQFTGCELVSVYGCHLPGGKLKRKIIQVMLTFGENYERMKP